MSKVNVYWKEECKYCVNRESCEYKEATEEYKNKLVETINKLDELKIIHGITKFNCDYFVCDNKKYFDENFFECGNNSCK